MSNYNAPGVYWEHVSPPVQWELATGIPAFIGYGPMELRYAEGGPQGRFQAAQRNIYIPPNEYKQLTHWEQFASSVTGGYLVEVIRAFFENGGRRCYVARLPDALPPVLAVQTFLGSAKMVDEIDLLCVPDIMRSIDGNALALEDVRQMQLALLEHCERRGDCFAILDGLPAAGVEQVKAQRQGLGGWSSGALYYPWLKLSHGASRAAFVPPCGHVAGVYARSDELHGVQKAPANEALQYVVDLERDVTIKDQEQLNPFGVNCLRNFPGRGIRVWGARTLSGQPAWAHVNVRRLFITVTRWLESHFNEMTFEPNSYALWESIERQLLVYFGDLFKRGALKGRTVQEAFYIKCNAETNTFVDQDVGRVVAEIGLAPLVPNEFVIVRLIQTAQGTTLTGPVGIS